METSLSISSFNVCHQIVFFLLNHLQQWEGLSCGGPMILFTVATITLQLIQQHFIQVYSIYPYWKHI